MSSSSPPRVTTAAELEAMTPAERHKSFEDSLILDLDQAPPALLAKARARAQEHIDRIAGRQA